MIDMIWFIREKIFRQKSLSNNIQAEELSEKQTTKMWYFLLFCMFLAIMTSAQWSLSIIKNIPDKPETMPYCITDMLYKMSDNEKIKESDGYLYNNNSYYSYDYDYSYNNCITYSQDQFDFTNEYNWLLPWYKDILRIWKNILELEQWLSNINSEYIKNQKDYELSLTEKIANEENWIYNKDEIKNNTKNNIESKNQIDQSISDLKNKIELIKNENNEKIIQLENKYLIAIDEYNFKYLLYKLYVAILSFIFSLLIFFVLYKLYVKNKIKNSPNTIIFSVATFAYGLILLQVSSLFIWDIIPHKLLEIIKNLFNLFTPLVYIVQFLWPLIIIAIFWFFVYKIQKRLYSPENVLKRIVADHKCPNCWNHIDINKNHCPMCSYEIQIKCEQCNNYTLKWLPYCSNCWNKNK